MNSIRNLVAKVPTPTAEAPPGSETFLSLLNWFFWGATVLCVAAIITVGCVLLFGGNSRSGDEAPKKLIYALIGCVVVGTASAIAGAATGA